jgi:hypothetical protein
MNADSTKDGGESVENSVPTQRLHADHGQREKSIQNQVNTEIFGTATAETKYSHLAPKPSYAIFRSTYSE